MKRRKTCQRTLIAAVAVLATAGFLAPPVFAEKGWVRVKNVRPKNVLWVRAGPSISFERIGFLQHNARHIRSFGCRRYGRSTWCRIRYRGTEGWVSKKYLAEDVRVRT